MKKTLASFPDKSPLQKVSSAAAAHLIRGYQVFVSPLLGPCCRFYPSCSEYTQEAIARYGLSKGVYLGARRLLKCHPFNPGGIDPVP